MSIKNVLKQCNQVGQQAAIEPLAVLKDYDDLAPLIGLQVNM